MGLFDVFTFKKQAAEIFSKENVNKFMSTARAAIIEQIKANCPGPEKMYIVVGILKDFVTDRTSKITNKLVIFLANQLLVVIPIIAQLIYDFLKEKVENL